MENHDDIVLRKNLEQEQKTVETAQNTLEIFITFRDDLLNLLKKKDIKDKDLTIRDLLNSVNAQQDSSEVLEISVRLRAIVTDSTYSNKSHILDMEFPDILNELDRKIGELNSTIDSINRGKIVRANDADD